MLNPNAEIIVLPGGTYLLAVFQETLPRFRKTMSLYNKLYINLTCSYVFMKVVRQNLQTVFQTQCRYPIEQKFWAHIIAKSLDDNSI
jgi:hypothetical protein